jgi:AcrR family transcriptional regulator
MPTIPEDRRARILDAAEQRFAAVGFAAASLRDIVTDARVNLATVYYYFGSKEGLVVAALKRRFGPLRDRNLALLDQAIKESAPAAPPVEAILDAMLRPVLELAQIGSQESAIILGLIGRMWTEPSEAIQQLLRAEFAQVRSKFFHAFATACRHLRKPDLLWRIETTRASVCAMLCNMQHIKVATGGVCDASDAPTVLSHLIALFAAGFRAPAAEVKKHRLPPPKRRSSPVGSP